jgi:hypothetical protein
MVSALSCGPVPAYVYVFWIMLGLAVVVLIRAVLNKFPGKRPPIFEEIPFLGGIIGFVQSPIDLGRRGYDALGEVRWPQRLGLCLSPTAMAIRGQLASARKRSSTIPEYWEARGRTITARVLLTPASAALEG